MKTLKNNSYLIVGLGNIGKILVKRLGELGVPVGQIMAADNDPGRIIGLADKTGAKMVELTKENIQQADVIIMATPPKTVVEILESMKASLQSGQIVISMAAAVPLTRMRSVLPEAIPVIRILPNPPSMLGKGMNPVAFESSVAEDVKAFVLSLLDGLGKTIEVSDDQMAWCVGLTGAALRTTLPVLEGMVQAGLEAGLTAAQARFTAAQIMAGTAALALETDLPLEQIRALTPMETLDEKMVSNLFLETARNTKQKVEKTQAMLMEN